MHKEPRLRPVRGLMSLLTRPQGPPALVYRDPPGLAERPAGAPLHPAKPRSIRAGRRHPLAANSLPKVGCGFRRSHDELNRVGVAPPHRRGFSLPTWTALGCRVDPLFLMGGRDGQSGKVPSLRRHDLSTAEGAARGRVPGLRPVVYNRPRGATGAGADREAEAAGIAAAACVRWRARCEKVV